MASELIRSINLKILSDMKWIKLTDDLPEHGQNIDLWLQPENGKGRRFNWTWEKQDSAAISINSIKATHWIAVGEPSDGNPDNSENANCAIFDVVWRSEQLKAYAEFLANTPAFQNYSNKDLAIDYCDSL